MKLYIQMGLLTLFGVIHGRAAIVVPGANGQDNAFSPTAHIEVDLSKATPGAWDSAAQTGGNGVYDSNKWAVVFRYSSVNIPGGTTVTFRNHATHAPVVWLVTGDVTINGNIDLSASPPIAGRLSEPGPGGFRGGRDDDLDLPGTAGFGPGGGRLGNSMDASHRDRPNAQAGPAYGDANIRLLIGGSGGGGGAHYYPGGGGGGALMIAAQGRITINGTIMANGGASGQSSDGSGGVIRLIADHLDGQGFVLAKGGGSPEASVGYIRTEAVSYGDDPNTPATYPQAKIDSLVEPVALWPDESFPQTRIVSVSGLAVPPDPKASLGLAPADVALPAANLHRILVETRNLPLDAAVTVFVIPNGGDRFELAATNVSGDTALSTWAATLTNAVGRYALQVRAVAP